MLCVQTTPPLWVQPSNPNRGLYHQHKTLWWCAWLVSQFVGWRWGGGFDAGWLSVIHGRSHAFNASLLQFKGPFLCVWIPLISQSCALAHTVCLCDWNNTSSMVHVLMNCTSDDKLETLSWRGHCDLAILNEKSGETRSLKMTLKGFLSRLCCIFLMGGWIRHTHACTHAHMRTHTIRVALLFRGSIIYFSSVQKCTNWTKDMHAAYSLQLANWSPCSLVAFIELPISNT